MPDDKSKGELIKKSTKPIPKKIFVVKKVKKIVIKKPVIKQEPKQVEKPKEVEKKIDQKIHTERSKKIIYKKPDATKIKFSPDALTKPDFGKGKDVAGTPIPDKSDKDRFKKKEVIKQEIHEKKVDKQEEFRKAFSHRRNRSEINLNSIPDKIDIIDVLSISDLAKKMNIKANVLISKLMELGTMVTINDNIDAETAEILCSEFNCKVNIVSLYDETVIEEEKVSSKELKPRPPIVTVMGHVDHGKTKLLDAIRSTNVVAGESGGITQHIGAYIVKLPNDHNITFIDTPGHAAFTTMRARGANVTDIVILVVAADDGVMPQTIEAINHAKAANVPIIVVINKIDKEGANIDKIKQQLTDHDLLPEDWGGHTLYCEISALKKIGIDHLLELIILQSEMLELKSSFKSRGTGFVLESKIDPGRGVISTILILNGKLKVGDYFVAGVYSGKIRAMYNDIGEKIKEASPAMPVEITGIEKAPNAGDPFNIMSSEKESKIISAKRQELNRMEEARSVKKITLDDLIAQKHEGEQQELNIVIKADVQGSVEALKESLEKLTTKEIKISCKLTGVGAINERDVMFAVASKAIIIGFHVRPNPKAQELADNENVEIRRYNIIYDVIEDITASITGMIKPDLIEEMIGVAEVKQTFKVSKIGIVSGCIVSSGVIRRKSLIRLLRDDVVIYSGKIKTLKRFKDDASEVNEGTECGIGLENCKDIKEGDTMEAYEIKEIARSYEDIKD